MLSPLDGNPFQTRDDVAKAAQAMVDPLIPHFSEGRARVRLGHSGARHDLASADLEGFARPLWGIVPLAAGGYDFPYWDMWREGLANGTDPDHPEFWGLPDDNNQRLVEMAALGFALRLVPEHVWEPLPTPAKRNLVRYLQSAHRCAFASCNWKFFRILIGLGLAHVGEKVDLSLHDAYFDDLDSYYLSNGWYYDGKPKQVDHYIPFAFHFYGLLYASLADDPVRAEVFRDRAAEFADGIRHWYAEDGAALPFGRSLTYRFAHAGIWGAYGFAGLEALPWGEIKGLYLRNLRWWAGQPVFDAAGLMTIGYSYPNLLMSEGYNGPGSPYWAMKAFLPLALSEDHPFWQAEETLADAPPVTPIPEAAMVVQSQRNHKVALTSGQELGYMRHGAEKYSKFAYSTRYGFSIEVDERQFNQAASDNMLTLSDDEVHFRMREGCEAALMAGELLWSRWRPFSDVTIQSWVLPAGVWHLRIHEIDSPRPLDVIEGGFSVPVPAYEVAVTSRRAAIRTEQDLSIIVGGDQRQARVHKALPNSNLIFPRSLVPQLGGRIGPGRVQLFTAVAAGSAGATGDFSDPPPFPAVDALRMQIRQQGVAVPGSVDGARQ